MTDQSDLRDEDDGIFDGLDLNAALIGVGRSNDGWDGAVATGRRRRRRRAGLVATCLTAAAVGGLLIASRGTESSGPTYVTDETTVASRGPVVYFLPPPGATPTQYPSVDTTGVYNFQFQMPDGNSWQLSSSGPGNDNHITRWTFDTYADRQWSIDSEQFGTIEMSCRTFPDDMERPEGLPQGIVLAQFSVDGIYYHLNGSSQGSMVSNCNSAEQIDAQLLQVLDGLNATDLQTWMNWTGTTTVNEPLPAPPSTDIPN